MRHRKAIAAAVLLIITGRAAADPPVIIHLKSDADCVSTKGSHFQLPPGYELDEPTWATKDAEMRRLQDAETRLSAENTSLKASASDSVSWKLVVTVASVAFAAGYAATKL